eukprot:9403739-Heterocapsa_arctica.AAC.1
MHWALKHNYLRAGFLQEIDNWAQDSLQTTSNNSESIEYHYDKILQPLTDITDITAKILSNTNRAPKREWISNDTWNAVQARQDTIIGMQEKYVVRRMRSILETAFSQWARYTPYLFAARQVSKLVHQDREHFLSIVAMELEDALNYNDAAMVW